MTRQIKHEIENTIRTGKRVDGWDMRVCEGWDGLD